MRPRCPQLRWRRRKWGNSEPRVAARVMTRVIPVISTKKTSFIKCIIPLKSPVITFINGHVTVKPLLMDVLMNDEPWGFKHHCLINTTMGKVYFDIKNTIQLWPFISYNWL